MIDIVEDWKYLAFITICQTYIQMQAMVYIKTNLTEAYLVPLISAKTFIFSLHLF